MSAIDLLRTIGKYFRVGTMLNKDIVARRIASDEGISYTEFSYQVLQANDFLELYRRNGCTLETGGNDQWGNMVGGVDLIRKVEGVDTHVITTPIITKADGTKFGKSEGGAIWLDPEMMTPYAFYLADQVDAAHHVAPLVVAAGLEGATIATVQLEEVVGLEDLVGELRVRDAFVGGDAACDDVFVQHGPHAEVLANGTQQVDGAHLLGPIQVVYHLCGGRSLEVQKLRDLSA